MLNFIKQKAFTLAEVLIVLGVLGVVAAITIPNLGDNIDEDANVAQLRKTFNELSVAYEAMVTRDGSPEGRSVTTTAFAQKFLKGLDVAKACGLATNTECFYDDGYNMSSTSYKARLKNGVALAIKLNSSPETIDLNCSSKDDRFSACTFGQIMVDVNGKKGPNGNGIDIFGFNLTRNGVEPMGYDFEGDIRSDTRDEEELSAWVIKAGNMDYLHCTVTWPTKKSCN